MAERIEAQFQALRYFAIVGTDRATHREQASMIRRYIHWRSRNAHDRALRELVKRAHVAWHGTSGVSPTKTDSSDMVPAAT